MRSLMFAVLCGAATLFCAPEAKAQQPAQEPQISDEAPVDVEAERMFCPRRMGGPSARQAVRRCVSVVSDTAPSYGGGDTCAVRYAYRGHRRINYRPRSCDPLFQRRATSAI